MRQLAVVHPEFETPDPGSKFSVLLFGERIHFVMDDSFPALEQPLLGATDVLVLKKGFSLNYRDLNFIATASRYFIKSNNRTAYLPVGSEFVGEVAAVGHAVRGLKKGDRVIPNWNYEDVLLRKKRAGLTAGICSNSTSREQEIFHFEKLCRIPPEFPSEIAAGFSIGAQTAISMLRKAGLTSRTRLLLTSGTSSTSFFVLKMLSAFAYKSVCILTSSSQKAALIRQLGIKNAEVIINKVGVGDEPVDEEILHRLRGQIDVVIDPFCNRHLKRLYQVLAFNGKYISCGLENNALSGNTAAAESRLLIPEELMIHFITNNITFTGNCLGTAKDLDKAVKLYTENKVDLALYRAVSDKEAAGFVESSFNDKNRIGKVVCMYG